MDFKDLENRISCGRGNEVLMDRIADDIYVLVYTNPHLFKLEKLDPDERSEFLFSIWKDFKKIPRLFDAEKACLYTYLKIILKKSYTSWQRRRIKNEATEKTVFSLLSQEYTDSFCMENSPSYGDFSGFQSSVNKKLLDSLSPCHLLIVALKLTYYLTESWIIEISPYAKVSPEQLWNLKQKLDSQIEKKVEGLRRQSQSLNTSYILRNRYRWELEHMQPGSKSYLRMEKAYRVQEARWRSKIDTERIPQIIPTNAQIAELLRMEKKHVDNILSYVKRHKGWKQEKKSITLRE